MRNSPRRGRSLTRILRKLVASAVAAVVLGQAVGAAAQTVEYYHLDALGSVRAITDQNAAVIERHDYLPFGEEWNPQPSIDARKFTGKERDLETGYDYFGARYLSSKTARFTTTDPSYTLTENLVDPQRWNRYSYVRNSPMRYVDPDGRVVRVADDKALNIMKSTVPASLRQFIGLTKDNRIDPRLINSAQTTNANFLDLRALVNSVDIVDVRTGLSASFVDSDGHVLSVDFLFRTGMAPATFLGITLLPAKGHNLFDTAAAPRSLTGTVDVILAALAGVPIGELRKTAAHELYGHALLYLQHERFLHGDPGVNAKIDAIEKRSR